MHYRWNRGISDWTRQRSGQSGMADGGENIFRFLELHWARWEAEGKCLLKVLVQNSYARQGPIIRVSHQAPFRSSQRR